MQTRLCLLVAIFVFHSAQAYAADQFSGITVLLNDRPESRGFALKVSPLQVSKNSPVADVNVGLGGTHVSIASPYGNESFLVHIRAEKEIRVSYSETIAVTESDNEFRGDPDSTAILVMARQKKATFAVNDGEAWLKVRLPSDPADSRLFLFVNSTRTNTKVRFEVSRCADSSLNEFRSVLGMSTWDRIEPLRNR